MTDKALSVVSNRALGRRLGVDEKAVRKAIASGRFRECLAVDDSGRRVVVDADIAEREWRANASRLPRADKAARTAESAPTQSEPGLLIDAATLSEAQRRATIQRERKLRLENDQAEGRLVSVELVKKEAFEAERTIRESILNIPARISGELAAETDAGRVFARLDAALREALSATADLLLATANG